MTWMLVSYSFYVMQYREMTMNDKPHKSARIAAHFSVHFMKYGYVLFDNPDIQKLHCQSLTIHLKCLKIGTA